MVSTVGGWKPPLLGLRRITSSAELWILLKWHGFQSAFVETGFIPLTPDLRPRLSNAATSWLFISWDNLSSQISDIGYSKPLNLTR